MANFGNPVYAYVTGWCHLSAWRHPPFGDHCWTVRGAIPSARLICMKLMFGLGLDSMLKFVIMFKDF